MSLIVPHWIPSNLWWALPLLAAALGAALRRVLPRTAAARGAPVCLLAGLAGALIWRGALVAGLASRGWIWSTGLPLLALAVLAAGGAAACALLDDRRGSAMAAAAAVPWLVCMAAALYGHYVRSYGSLHPGLLALTLAALAAAVLAFAGALAPVPAPEAPAPPPESGPAGSLTVLCGAFAGHSIPLPAGEEVALGRDAARCHLVLDVADMPACLCTVRWLAGRDTYLVTCQAQEGLLWADGRSAPSGSTIEMCPGSGCSLAAGQPVIRLG